MSRVTVTRVPSGRIVSNRSLRCPAGGNGAGSSGCGSGVVAGSSGCAGVSPPISSAGSCGVTSSFSASDDSLQSCGGAAGEHAESAVELDAGAVGGLFLQLAEVLDLYAAVG